MPVLAVVTLVVLALVLGVLGRTLGRVLFSENPRYTIRTYDLQSDGRLEERHMREYAQLDQYRNLFALRPRDIRQRLESVPIVREVHVRRQLPDTLSIRVRERVPLASLPRTQGNWAQAVDREGVVLGPTPWNPALPVIEGLGAAGIRPGSRLPGGLAEEALEIIDLCRQPHLGRHLPIRSIHVGNPERLRMVLTDGTRVDLGRDRIEWRLRSTAAIRQHALESGRRVVSIDATRDQNFPVVYD